MRTICKTFRYYIHCMATFQPLTQAKLWNRERVLFPFSACIFQKLGVNGPLASFFERRTDKKGRETTDISRITSLTVPSYSQGEELANSITHGVGAVLAIVGLAVMTAFATLFGNAWHIVSCSVFGATLILLYTTSTLYHSIQLPQAKTVLRVLDHAAIFLLIAGTYTPFMLVNMRGPWGWSLFGIVWMIALLGVIFQAPLLRRWPVASVGIYVGMGLIMIIAIKPLLATLTQSGMLLLFAGGITYIAGLVFYGWQRLPYHHAVWHLFVLGGSACHFFAILLYVIPVAT
jgi:hemolysin III